MQMLNDAIRNWIAECNLRKAYIAELKKEWRRRVAERKAADQQWRQYVEEARNAVKEAESYPTPRRPY